jgi:ribosomal protein L13E
VITRLIQQVQNGGLQRNETVGHGVAIGTLHACTIHMAESADKLGFFVPVCGH